MKCEFCKKEKTKNHHYETEINQLLQQYKDNKVGSPWFKDGTIDFLLVGSHVMSDDTIRIHEEQHWDGQIIDKEYCDKVRKVRAKSV